MWTIVAIDCHLYVKREMYRDTGTRADSNIQRGVLVTMTQTSPRICTANIPLFLEWQETLQCFFSMISFYWLSKFKFVVCSFIAYSQMNCQRKRAINSSTQPWYLWTTAMTIPARYSQGCNNDTHILLLTNSFLIKICAWSTGEKSHLVIET